MRKPIIVLSLSVVTLAVAPACATKKFVQTEVGQVNQKVASLGTSLEQTQERVRRVEGRVTETEGQIKAVDTRAGAAQTSATQAQQAANSASSAAAAVNTRADTIEAAVRKMVYEVVLSEDQGKFKFADTGLPTEAKSAIDSLVNNFKGQKSAVWIEIEGHTDNIGDSAYNERLGLSRAEAAKRYLYEQHQIPLHKMNVISYGEDKPASENKTREGRAQNRRVVIRVLA